MRYIYNVLRQSSTILLLIFTTLSLFSQDSFKRLDSVRVFANGQELLYPWTGGFNNPQFSSVDINNDNIKDLVVFDRSSQKVLTFTNNGSSGTIDYQYAPEFQHNFPTPLYKWVILVDFNNDGIADLFTNLPNNWIKVYKGRYDTADQIAFDLFVSRVYYQGSSSQPIQVISTDVPAITDVDGDGDIDILTFDWLNSVTVTYYENIALESGFGDSLFFDDIDHCWGNFKEDGLTTAVTLNQTCKGGGKTSGTSAHSGSTLLALDIDSDNDKDLILGDVSYQNLILLTNGGDSSSAHMISQDTLFPKNSIAVDIDVFPAAFLADVDNDGLEDILASPNGPFSSNTKNVWWYKNVGNDTAIFEVQTDSFLVGDMIDLGEGANPVFFDHNGDSLLDIIVGNYGYYQGGNYHSRLALYENTGQFDTPEYTLVTKSYYNISNLAPDALSLYPAFGDLDGDGDQDMLIGSEDGTLTYYENTGGGGNIAVFNTPIPNYQNIDPGKFSTPQIVDVNKDGLLDLLIGERNGNINYYPNTGSVNSPIFDDANKVETFGNIVIKSSLVTGYTVPFLTSLDTTGEYYLLVGAEDGYIHLYGNIDNNLNGTFTLIDSTYEDIREGYRSTISGGDLNSDGKLEFLIGSYGGGISLYTTSDSIKLPAISVPPIPSNTTLSIYPNPSKNAFILSSNKQINISSISLYDLLGQSLPVDASILSSNTIEISTSEYSDGVYFLSCRDDAVSQSIKIIVQK